MGILAMIQSELRAPKNQKNTFGNYMYRSCEDILEAVKPILLKHDATLVITDDIVQVGSRNYVKATATLKTNDGEYVATAFAREPESKKGTDESQITGAASSYARKYALNGLFLIDDAKDADTNAYHNERQDAPKKNKSKYTDEQLAEMKRWNDGTFTQDELATIRKSFVGEDWLKNYESTKAEYAKRKSAGRQEEDLF